MEKIFVKIGSSKEQTVISQNDCYFELFPDRIVQVFDFQADDLKDMEDSLGERIERYYVSKSIYRKDKIIGIEIKWINEPDLWKVSLILATVHEDAFFCVETEAEAMSIFLKLENWLFSLV